MRGDDLVSKVVAEWTAKAENNLKNAAHTLKLGEDCPTDTVCFHAQQCVEKYLKALLVCLRIDFPKAHDLSELIVSTIKEKKVIDAKTDGRIVRD